MAIAAAVGVSVQASWAQTPVAPVAPRQADSTPSPCTIFDAADAAPSDVLAWARLRDGAKLIGQADARELGVGLLQAIAPSAPSTQLSFIAERLGMPPEEVFRRYLGRDARFFVRRLSPDAPTLEWAILTRVEQADVDRLVRELDPVVKPGGRFELPAEHLAFAYRAGWLVAAGDSGGRLYLDLAERFEAPLEPSLAATVGEVGPAGMPEGRLGIVYVGSGALEGKTLLSLDVRGSRMHAVVRGRYAEAPFPAAQQSRLDLSILASMGDEVLAASVDPIRPRVTPGDAFLVASFPELVPPAAFRNNLGAQRYVLVGEVDGGAASPPLSMRCPAIAVAYEVEDPDQARDEQDHLMKSALRGFGRRTLAGGVGAGKEPADPDVVTGVSGERSVAVRPMLEQLAGEHPLLRGCSLNWQVVRGRDCAWQVYATHPAWLAKVRTELESLPKPCPDAERCQAASAGKVCGQRLASHLRSWTNEAPAFAGADAAGFTKGIELLAGVAERFRSVSWTIGRPSERGLEISVEAHLAPPQSAEPAQRHE